MFSSPLDIDASDILAKALEIYVVDSAEQQSKGVVEEN